MWLWLLCLLPMDDSPEVRVAEPAAVTDSGIDFDTTIMPIITKAGCNTGACHGAATGRAGFHLSLYGSRPADDYAEIVLALEGRRVDRRNSELSLLLLKPTEQLSHEGGTRLGPDGPDIRTLQQWIRNGARRNTARTLQTFIITADRSADDAMQFRITANAAFSDGRTQNVLPWTVLTPNDPSAIHIDNDGQITALRMGRHLVMARYLDQVRPLELIATSVPQPSNPKSTEAPQTIDTFIDRRLAEFGVTAMRECNDQAFIRRATLDLTGRLPSAAAVLAFAEDSRPDKRRELIDRLLESPQFVDFWAFRRAMLLRLAQTRNQPAAAAAWFQWVRNSIRDDVPLPVTARQLLLAEGPVDEIGPAGFYNVAGDARAQAELVSHVFLGIRLQCANCHDHPLDQWTQDDYHGLAAIFAPIKRGPVIRMTTSGSVIHPATGEPAIAKIPGRNFLLTESDHRTELAAWITSADNSWFATAAVNRTWSHLLGRGLVDPVDDLRVTNPPSHPELLQWLTETFKNDGFRLKPLLRRICNSHVYARQKDTTTESSPPAELYASAIARPLLPEVFLDAVSDVTGVASTDRPTVRAISLEGLTADSEALNLLGRCTTFCEAEAVDRTNLSTQLHLLNGSLLNQRLIDPQGYLMQRLQKGCSAEDLVQECYLRCLSRRPDPTESNYWQNQFPTETSSAAFAEVAQDFLWSLLSSREFSSLH